MPDPAVQTAQLHAWLERMRAGDAAASDELLRVVCGRLERLARKLLRGFPRVRRWVQTDDVLQNALLRLLRALREIRPASTRAFFGLAAVQMRRELLDLARHFLGPEGQGFNHATGLGDGTTPAFDPPDAVDDAAELERWCAFHQAVEGLAEEEREVVGLLFYHGLKQAEAAELLQVSERTVRSRWAAALRRLHHLRNDGDPGE